MKRVRLRVAYRGSRYHGWQKQDGVETVEGQIRRGLSRLLNCSEQELRFQGASRTDAGVHALAQTVHFEHDSSHDEWTFVRGLNALTPDDITILRAEEVDAAFDARRSSGGKIYRYRIWNHRFPNPLMLEDAWHVIKPLDLDAMREAASYLVGEHDFAGFRASDCQANTTVRHIRGINIELNDPCEVLIWVEGDAFLKYMVRIISGTLKEVGAGRYKPSRMKDILESGDRTMAGITAPAAGLTLMHIFYPDFPWKRGEPTLGGQW